MLEDVPVHGSAGKPKDGKATHQRNLSLDFKQISKSSAPPPGCGHQRNRSLDSVLQRIPEDVTPQSPCGFPPPTPRLALPPELPAGSDDSGIHAPLDVDDEEERPPALAGARSRESLDSGNPEEPPDPGRPPPPPPNEDSLLRLFESNLFDASLAVWYLFRYAHDSGVCSYLGNKLFALRDDDMDRYLPQLTVMYIELAGAAEALRPYLIRRCRRSSSFALRLCCLLASYSGSSTRATQLRDQILAGDQPARRGHARSRSDASALRPAPPVARYLGDLASGRAFDNGCLCVDRCACAASSLATQIQFLTELKNIGRRLTGLASKEVRNGQLRAELTTLNLNLPARVWLPLHDKPHFVLRIPLVTAAVLNSKDKVPYIMYVEVLEVEGHKPLPPRLLPPAPPAPLSPPIRHTKSEECLPEWPSIAPPFLDELDADDCWSHDDDELSINYPTRPLTATPASDSISLLSTTSAGSGLSGSRELMVAGEVRIRLAGEVRKRLVENTTELPANVFKHDPNDPSVLALKESWEKKLDRVGAVSPYSSLPGWRLLGCIVKVGDDLRQEMLAAQLLRVLQSIWDRERVSLKLTPYEILCLDSECGLMQPVLNAVSLHQIKKQSGLSLRSWLEMEHGPPNSEGFLSAQKNFVRSAAGYALTSYLLQLKDRHNGNILLDREGHIVHIDFGFIFSISPKNLRFENSPFKLTPEFVEVMDGVDSDMFTYFKFLMLQGLIAARKHCEQLIHIVEIMKTGGQMACLKSNSAVLSFRARFHMSRTEDKLKVLIDRLVADALNSITTRLYDNYQYYANGIL